MSIPSSLTPLFSTGAGGAAGYQIERSLRFNSSDSAYLSRTPAVAGDRRTFTWAGWIKRCKLGSRQSIFSAGTGYLSGDPGGGFYFNSTTDTLSVVNGGATSANLTTAQVFRDVSAWFHLVAAYDTTQGTDSNRIKIYVNGTQITISGTYPGSNFQTDVNNTIIHAIGSRTDNGPLPSSTADYYLADVYLIDGQALTPSSFTEVSATTGQLIPKAYSGTFGTNGFWLKFSDNSALTSGSNVGVGKDYSGNANYFNTSGLSVTAGAGNDSLVDTPTSYGTDTGVGGEVRGNYATLNPLNTGATSLANGNLEVTTPSTGYGLTYSTIAISSGKWYWEVSPSSMTGNSEVGIAKAGGTLTNALGSYSLGYSYVNSALKGNNSSYTSYGASYTTNDIIGVALDLDAGTLVFYKNGSSQGTAFSSLSGEFFPAISDSSNSGGSTFVANFGQRAFAYQTPGTNRPAATFKALCDTNLGAPLVAKPNTLMDVALYTGNGSTQTISGLNFSPDFLWFKSRSSAFSHLLVDQIRGGTKVLYSTDTSAEVTSTGGITSWNSDGFTVAADTTFANSFNTSASSVVAWAWDAGTSTVSNPDGSITSQVRANVSAGFSVATLTTPGSGTFTVGHGLNVAPSLVICKARNATFSWIVYHRSAGAGNYLVLNNTADSVASATVWQNTNPSSTIVYGDVTNWGTADYVMYSFAPVVGYSSFGSYTGNGSADGPFVYTGFRPRWILIKNSSATADWSLFDTARDSYNQALTLLAPNLSAADNVLGSGLDILSNGFKLRRDASAAINASTNTFVFAAFAENPFQYARAR